MCIRIWYDKIWYDKIWYMIWYMRCIFIYTATFGIENDCIFSTQCIYVFHIVSHKPLFSNAELTSRSLKLWRCMYTVRCNLRESQRSKFFSPPPSCNNKIIAYIPLPAFSLRPTPSRTTLTLLWQDTMTGSVAGWPWRAFGFRKVSTSTQLTKFRIYTDENVTSMAKWFGIWLRNSTLVYLSVASQQNLPVAESRLM